MRLRALALATLLPASVLGAVAAGETATDCRAAEGHDGPTEICRTQVWLECDDTAPVVHEQNLEGNATWGTQAPTASWMGGDPGCGEYDDTIFGETSQDGTLYSFDIAGFVKGNVDEMTVELHNLDLGSGRGGDVVIHARITIDGKSPLGEEVLLDVTGEPHANPTRLPITISPIESNQGATNLYRFTVTGIGDAIETVSAEKADKNHYVIITIDVSTDDAVRDRQEAPEYVGFNPWVWGAVETPSGIIFNGLEGEDKGTIVESVASEG